MAKPNVIVKDRGWNEIKKHAKQLKKARAASVGIQGSLAELKTKGHEDKTNVEIGLYNEFGSQKISGRPPERSFIRSTFDENMPKYQKIVDDTAKKFFDLGPLRVDGELLLLGELCKKNIIDKMKSGIPPELSERTIKIRMAKGETKFTPLIFTGQLMNSLSVEVVDRASKKS